GGTKELELASVQRKTGGTKAHRAHHRDRGRVRNNGGVACRGGLTEFELALVQRKTGGAQARRAYHVHKGRSFQNNVGVICRGPVSERHRTTKIQDAPGSSNAGTMEPDGSARVILYNRSSRAAAPRKLKDAVVDQFDQSRISSRATVK